jgi:long-chain-fatty-acid--CoA ligase ACSBG
VEFLGPIAVGSAVYFAQPDALKGSLGDTLKEVQPTMFLGVPRIWEKMAAAIQQKEANMGLLARSVFSMAKRIGAKRTELRRKSPTALPFGYGFASSVFKKIHAAIGLDKAEFCLTGAAPVSTTILEYLDSIGILIVEGYGMSELGGHTINRTETVRIGSVGQSLPYLETKLCDVSESGEGEVCMRGRNRFMGYSHSEAKTRDAVDSEGWCHSGDLGRIDQDGFLYITGRIKELLITAGGENVAPVPIEDNIKMELPCISNAMVVGDRRKFLSVLLTIQTEVDHDTGSPLDTLTPVAREWCRSAGCDVTTVTELLIGSNKPVMDAIEAGITRVNKKSVSNAQKIQKFKLLPVDFSIAGGEMGPTMKTRRQIVCAKYADVINDMYPSD